MVDDETGDVSDGFRSRAGAVAGRENERHVGCGRSGKRVACIASTERSRDRVQSAALQTFDSSAGNGLGLLGVDRRMVRRSVVTPRDVEQQMLRLRAMRAPGFDRVEMPQEGPGGLDERVVVDTVETECSFHRDRSYRTSQSQSAVTARVAGTTMAPSLKY
jgi:hypothetical protein